MTTRRAIGGSDLGCVVAYYRPQLAAELCKYATAADVWMRLVHDVERPRTTVMQRGIDAEPRLRRAYLDAYGGAMLPKPTPWIVPHPKAAGVSVSPDDVWFNPPTGLPVDSDAARDWYIENGGVYVEFKSTSIFALRPPNGGPTGWGDADTDVIPFGYQLQVQLGLEILDMEDGHLFVGFGRDFKDENDEHQFLYEETRRYVLRRDRELAGMALADAVRFHTEHILTRQPPSVEPLSNKRVWKRLLKEQPWKATEAVQPSP